ncbi:hypothetical protein BD769DRAFT_1402987 [Suillus cothurnatus]|nr:hypothetical protein BD769DRAFT_1402987 [Suillus cothurnatus]
MQEIKYTADDVAAAMSLQISSYIYTSMATFWVGLYRCKYTRPLLSLFVQTYSYICSLHEEWTFLLRSRWTKVKCLYIIARYVPFFLFTSHLYMNFTPDEDPNKCLMLDTVCSCFSQLSVLCSESFFVLRTYALWNNNKIVLAALLAAFLTAGIASVGVFFGLSGSVPCTHPHLPIIPIIPLSLILSTIPVQTSPIPGITGCYQPSASIGFFVPYVLLSVLELGLISLTLVRALQTWRTANTHIFAVLLKHNIFYYACGLFCSVVNVLTSLLLHHAYKAMFQDFQFIILAILATNMHLHLWHMDQDLHGSDAFTLVPISEISYGVAGSSSISSAESGVVTAGSGS